MKIKAEALQQMTYLYINRKEYHKAAVAIDSAIIVNPKDSALYNTREELQVITGKKE